MSKYITEKSIRDLLNLINSDSVTIKDVLNDVIRAQNDNKSLNALSFFPEDTFNERGQNSKKGSLHGIPFVAKDNINTSDMPTSACTTALLSSTPKTNAKVIDDLIAEGAILVGKGGMHELALGITCNNAATGAIRNLHDPSKIPGGSSGGPAVAVAVGMVPFSLGTDTGGSCRIPAALCGITGFRPSNNRYSREGLVPISHSRDTVGLLTRSIDDLLIVDRVLAHDPKPITPRNPNSIKLGIDPHLLCADLEPQVEDAFKGTIEKLKQTGVSIHEIDISKIWEHNAAYSFIVVFYEIMRDLPNYLATYAPNINFQDQLVNQIASPDVKEAIQQHIGEHAITQEAYDAAVNTHLPIMRKIYQDATKDLDGIIFPTTPLRAINIGEDETTELNGKTVPVFPTFIRNTDIGSNLSLPCITMPIKTAGLPIGIEIDGKAGHDRELLSVALGLESLVTS